MAKIDEVLSDVLSTIKPSVDEEELALKNIEKFLDKLSSVLKDADVFLGGSLAKGTWLPGKYDVDIFVRFPLQKYKLMTAELSDLLESMLKKKFKNIVRLHGSRDYFQIMEGGIGYEIVPIFKITKPEQAENITDISPLHVKWVRKSPKLKDDIRLVKAFAKANGFYGAESYIKGFSGYVLEILTIYYGGFLKLLKAVSKWKETTVIDPLKYHKNVMFEVNQSKLVSPLILIDPVQAGRNTAASLNQENYDCMITSAKKFLANPAVDAFIKKNISKKELLEKSGKNKLLYMEAKIPFGKEDIVGSKLLKVFSFIESNLKSNDFLLVERGWEFDKKTKAIFWFIVPAKKLDSFKEWPGPPLKAKDNVVAFKKKYKQTYIKGKRIYAKVKRKFTDPGLLLKSILNDKYIKEKKIMVKLK